MALKFQFNKLTLRIRQFMMQYPNQECPDIYEHMKMLREVNDVFSTVMDINYGNDSEIELEKIGPPQAMSSPEKLTDDTYDVPQMTPQIRVTDATFDVSDYRTALGNSAVSPQNLQVPNHQRVFSAVQNLERTLEVLPSPVPSSPRPIPRKGKKTTQQSRLTAPVPRKGLNFPMK
jgi:hypothetical protein